MSNQNNKPKHRGKLEALGSLSLGISMVVAVAVGVGVGILLKSWTGYAWTLWIGVFWGVAAAGLNVKKEYDKAQKSFKELEDDPKYKYRAQHGIKGDDE